MKVKTENNFLATDDFNKLRQAAYACPFHFYGYVSNVKKLDGYYFVHEIFKDFQIYSGPMFEFITPLLHKLNIKSLIRARINLYPSTHKILDHDQHTDTDFKCNSFILSLNTCDGFTRVGKNKKIPSIENQGIFFDSDMPHNSSTCTDEKVRTNININYF